MIEFAGATIPVTAVTEVPFNFVQNSVNPRRGRVRLASEVYHCVATGQVAEGTSLHMPAGTSGGLGQEGAKRLRECPGERAARFDK